MKRLTPGVATLTLLLGAMFWSTSGIYIRSLSLSDPFEAAFWRALFMTIFIVAYLTYRYRRAWFKDFARLGWAGYASAVVEAVLLSTFIISLHYTTVSSAVLIMCVEPLLAALGARIFLNEKLYMVTRIALVGSIVGLILIFDGNVDDAFSETAMLGNALALLASVCYAGNIVLLKTLPKDVSLYPVIVLGGLIAVVANGFISLPFTTTAHDIGVLALMGSAQLGVGVLLFFRAVPYLSAVQIALLSLIEPIAASLWMWLFFNEVPSLRTMYGGMLVIAMVIFNELWLARRAAPPTLPPVN